MFSAMDGPLEPRPAAQTQSIGILVVPEFSSLTLAAITEPLRAANRAAGRPLYRHRLLTPDGGPVASSSGLRLAADGPIAEGEGLDALFVVASYNVKAQYRRPLLDWLRRAGARAGVVGGMESGPYLLARAGLLDGHRATTHWEDLDDFAAAFPEVRVVNARFVVDRNRVTTGGAIPTLDLMLNMIRHQHGLLLALDVGSTFIYEQDVAPADPQHVVSLGPWRWLEPRLAQAVELMEAHLGEPLPIAEIARRVRLSERTLQRLFRRRLEESPHRVYLSVRLNAARRLLAQTELSIAEVADACGFQSRVTFHRAFRRAFRQAPSTFRRAP